MRVRSKGLGRIELLFDMDKMDFTHENGHLVITGKTQRPVVWDFRITVSEEEVPSLVRIALRKQVRSLVSSFVLRALNLKGKESTQDDQFVHKETYA